MKLDMKDRGEEFYKVCINHDPGMTLNFFYSKVNLGCHAFEWGKLLRQNLQ